ncbi:MAG: mechanosensitive ion channel domain-containing protein [Chloroflexota bacterium]
MPTNIEQISIIAGLGLVTLIIAFILRRILRAVLRSRSPRARIYADFVWILIVAAGLIGIVWLSGLDTSIIIIFASLIGTTASFAFTALIEQWLSQGRIAFDQNFKPGDIVTIGDHFGEVKEISSSALILETPDLEQIIIPAMQVVDEVLIHHSAIGGAPVVVEVPIENTGIKRHLIKAVLQRTVEEFPNRLRGEDFEPKVYYSFKYGTVWYVEFFVADQLRVWDFESDISEIIADRLEEIGVVIREREVFRHRAEY